MSASGDKKRVKAVGNVDKVVNDEKDTAENTFYVAGIGGSAGGLEAFEQFFRSMPENAGIGFVVISHLDPTRKGSLPELLQRFTNMPVMEATEGVKVEPNHVYVIPSNKDLTISEGLLRLSEPLSPRGPRMPIDLFFRSLATDAGKMSIGIVFSGMGTDGTLGIKSIKEELGMVMAEDPSTSRFDSMPKSAIATGVVDYIAAPADMPKYLSEYTKTSHVINTEGIGALKNYTIIDRIFNIIKSRTGHDFSSYKMTTISRRIERRMSILQLTDTRDYVRYLENNIGEVDALFKELLIGVTSFFRDLEAFQVLEKTAIPEMLKKKPDGSIIRVWVPGCSTGEEAYSLAILLAESLGHRKDKVQIFATDIDRDAIDVARKGDYPDNIIADVSRERLKKFFVTEEDGHYKVKKEIRDMIVFAEQDVISDPPFTNMEIVSCRNLLIYLQPDVQNKILLLFLYALNPGGILFLGPSESVGQLNTAFAVIDNKWKIYRRQTYLSKKDMAATLPIAVSSPVERANIHVMKTEPAIANMAQSILLEYFSPPAVLINANGDIVYVNGHTGKYLEVAPGKAAMNVFTMARKGLAADLSIAVKRAEKEKKEVVLKGLEVHTNGDKQAINLLVKPIIYPEALKNYMLVVFQDVEVKKHRVGEGETITLDRCKEVSEELLYTKQRLQTTQEEMSASQEELRSLNEELQSTNEELQSTNEELTTSKEELQSLNEELVTVNSELQAKIDDLTRTSNDMNNLLNSTEIATIFLDNHLKIMRYTPSATKVVNIIQGDIGRPFTDISSVIDDEIVNDAKKVADDLTPVEREIRIKDGRWFNLRIIPYRTTENVIAGVVLTFNDITGLKRLEGSLIAARNYANNIIATIREPLIVLDSDMKVISANQSFFRDFKETPADTIGQDFFELDGGQWNIPELKKALKEVLPLEKEIEDFKVDYDFPKVGHKVILLNARVIESEDNKGLILLAFENMCHDGE